MWKEQKLPQALQRSSLLIAYLFLVTGAVIGFTYMQSITDRVERESLARTWENCEAVNNTKVTIAAILDRLVVVDRPDDTPERQAERLRLRQEVDDLLSPNDCPPPPPPWGR